MMSTQAGGEKAAGTVISVPAAFEKISCEGAAFFHRRCGRSTPISKE
jgi:hypothetical protein